MKPRDICAIIFLIAGAASASPLKVRVMPQDDRSAYLMPHWENWQWDGTGKPAKFGDISITLVPPVSQRSRAFSREISPRLRPAHGRRRALHL